MVILESYKGYLNPQRLQVPCEQTRHAYLGNGSEERRGASAERHLDLCNDIG